MTIFLSYLFYFVASSLWPLQRRWLAIQKNTAESNQISFAFEVVLILVIGSLFLPFFSPLYFSGNTFSLILLSLVCGLFGMGYFIASYVAQSHIDAGVTSIVSNIYTPITIILSSFFLHEGLKPLQIVGTLMLLASVFIVSKKHQIGKFRFDKYFVMMALSGVMMGVLIVAERALQKTTGFTASTMLSWGSQCFFLGLASLIYKSKHTYTNKEVLTTGGLRFLGALSYVILVWIVGNLSVVSSIITFKIVVISIAGAIFLKEREDLPRKILGCVIAVAGLLLMK